MSSSAPSLLAVVNSFPAPSETFILRKLQGLAEVGVDVQVAAATFTADAPETGLGLVPLVPWRDPRSSIRSLTTARGRDLVRDELRALTSFEAPAPPARRRILLAPLVAAQADIVHFEFSGIAVGFLDVLDRLRPAKLAVSCRGAAEQIVPLRDPTRGPALRQVFDTVDLIHCVSDDIRRTVEDLGAPPGKILVNRPAVPVADFAGIAARRTAHDGPLRVLSIGRLHWKKGFDDALRAMARLRSDGVDVDYRIAGEGTEREKLSFLCDQLELTDHVTLLGRQSQAEVKEQLAWADALLLPSLSEGISNAVLEGMASGLPVVSTDCGGMAEVITSGQNGFLVPVGDIEAMTFHLGDLARDPDLRNRLGAAAAERAKDEFDLSRQIGVFVNAYDRLLHP